MTFLSLVAAQPGTPPDTGRYEISPDLALVIGRDATCDIRIDESQDVVSRRHVTIQWDGLTLVAHDSSSNGLFINGQRVANSQPIHDEDVIQLGLNGPVFTVALDPKPVKEPPPAKETRVLAPTRPPQPVIEVLADSPPPAPLPSPPDSPTAQESMRNMARSGKELLSGAAASIKRSMEERAAQAQSVSPSSFNPSASRSPGGFMLSRIVVNLYSLILEIGLWVFLLAGVIGGWKNGGLLGALVGLVFVAILSAVFFGAFLVLSDIRQSVRAIESRLNAKE